MTNYLDDLMQARARIYELETWQTVDLANYKRHLAELEEMLTAATDTAIQRGKQLDAVRKVLREDPGSSGHVLAHDVQAALDRADGG